MATTKRIELVPTAKIVVSSGARNPFREGTAVFKRAAIALAARGKTVGYVQRHGVPIKTLRHLAQTKVIRLVPVKEPANKTAEIVSLMKRREGVTREEVLAVTGWKAVSMQQVADLAGVKLKVYDKIRPFKYRVIG